MNLSSPISILALVALVLLSLVLGACASTAEVNPYINPGTTDLVVRDLDLRGVENISERDLRAGLATETSPARFRVRMGQTRLIRRFPLISADPFYYNRFSWIQDRERIIAYYRQNGYFHASIVSESIIEDPENKTVRIRITIDEGEPTRVSDVAVQGLVEGLTPDQQTLLRGLPLREDEIFSQMAYRRTRSAIESRLQEAGHAYAVVSGQVHVDLQQRTASVQFYADPGPRGQIGPVHIFGLEEIDEQSIRDAIRLRQGDPYSPGVLRRAQEDIYDLGAFGMVTVLPAHEARDRPAEDSDEQRELEELYEEYDLPERRELDAPPQDPAASTPPPVSTTGGGVSSVLDSAQGYAESRSRLDPEVPIVIRLQEATGYSVRVGAGLAAESTRQDIRGLLNWTSRNFLGGLRRLEHFNAVGYAWSPGLIGTSPVDNRGVILSSELRFQQPQFFDPRTTFRSRARVSRDVREAFSVWNPSLRLSVDRSFGRHFIVDLSYNLAYFRYFNINENLLDAATTELALDFRQEFLLEYFEQNIAYDRRNDVIDPRRGYRVDLSVQQASRYIAGGAFDFIKPVLSAEYYHSMGERTVLALRSRLGTVYDIGRDSGVPYQSRLYSGGTDSMRSFGRRRLSLYTPTGDDAVPIGGLTQFEASLEPRFRLIRNLANVGDLWGALFVDSATVLGGQLLVDTGPNTHGIENFQGLQESLLYGAGAGMWWNTPVGPVRFDFAYTLSDVANDTRFRRCETDVDYNTPNCVFVPLEQDAIQRRIRGYGVYLSIGHSF